MPHGSGESKVGKKVFIGKGSLLLPSLRKPSPLPDECASVFSADDGPPSPCSSVTLSCFSATSDEACLWPENNFLKSNLNAFGHPYKSNIHHQIPAYASPSPNRCAKFGTENKGGKIASKTQSIVTNHGHSPTAEDFVAATDRTKISSMTLLRAAPKSSEEDVGRMKISSLTGINIGSKMTTSTAIPDGKSHRKYIWPGINKDEISSSFHEDKRYGSTPNVFSSSQLSSNDFVCAMGHRTPPPDFIDRDSTAAGNVQTISAQPDLSVMLSGAVRSCALLKNKPDFIPFAVMPRDKAMEKSKSLSDLTIRKEKTARFLDRRKLIRMDPDDKECCSHTEVAPSSMMTLALELLVSKDNKAASLFKEAKKKANDAAGEKDSILPSLWVIPKALSPDSAGKMASHLQAVVKNNCRVQLPFKKMPVTQKEARYATDEPKDQAEFKKGFIRRSSSLKSDTKEPRFSNKTACSLSEAIRQYEEKQILSEDIERDLKTLTVADLVGSPDTVFTDDENEVDPVDCDPKPSTSSVKITTYRIGGKTSSTGRRQFSKLRKNESREDMAKRDTNVKKASRDLKTESIAYAPVSCRAQFEEMITYAPPVVNCAPFADDKEKYDGSNRRSSCLSNSSSLTNVSSLSLSSASVGSIELPARNAAKAPTLYHIYDDDSVAVPSKPDEINLQKATAVNSPKLEGKRLQENCSKFFESRPIVSTKLSVCDFCPNVSGTTAEIESAAPRPPRRSKSFGVVGKIRKNSHGAEVSSKSLGHRTDYDCWNPGPSLDRNIKQRTENAVLATSLANTVSLNVSCGGMPKNNCLLQSGKHSRAVDVKPEERHQSALLISNEGQKQFVGAPPDRPRECNNQIGCDTHRKSATETHKPICKGSSACDECIKCEGKVSKTAARDCQEETPIQVYPYLATESAVVATRSDSCGETPTTSDMMSEAWFRNGEISVVDGSKVSLVRKAKPDSQRQQRKASCDLYLSDIIYGSEDKSHSEVLDNYQETPAEEDFVRPICALQVGSHQPSALYSRETAANPSAEVKENFREHPGNGEFIPSKLISPSRSEVLEQFLPAYKGAGNSKPLGNKVGTHSYNACAKPYCANIASQPNRSPRDLSSDISKSFPAGSQPQQRQHDPSSILSDDNAPRVEQAESGPGHSRYNEGFNSTQADMLSAEKVGEHDEQAATNRTAAPYRQDSVIKSLTQGQGVYSSSMKITLDRSKSKDNLGIRRWENLHGTPLDFGRTDDAAGKGITPKSNLHHRPVRRNSFPVKEERGRNVAFVRGAITPDMKVREEAAVVKPDAPQHSAVDDGDFAGVVDGPTKNVGEIRAMFKGPDYADYAKPKLLLKKPPPLNAKSKVRTERIPSNSNRNSAEVAQQVIGLFKGALTLEDDVIAPSPPAQQTTPTLNWVETETTEYQTTVKDKVTSFNSGASPTKKQEVNNNEETVSKAREKSTESAPYAEIIANPAHTTNGHAKKAGVKQEKVLAESYDESLDQFYDVLEELTAS